jgi:tetratricopeptide (TPR) repeat protein
MNKFNLHPRDIFSLRDDLYNQSVESIRRSAVFGIGGGNFIKASKVAGPYEDYSDSAHNIFLEVAVEQGIPAVLFFIIMSFSLIFQAIRKKDVWSYVIIYLSLNFLTDYTYKIYFLSVITAIISGICYEEKKSFRIPVWLYGMMGFLLFITVFLMFTSNFFLLINKPASAIRWYPLNKQALIQAIRQESDRDESRRLINRAFEIAPDDVGVLTVAAEQHLKRGEKKEALDIFKRMYESNHYIAFSVIRNIYVLTRELYGKEESIKSLIRISRNYENYTPFGSYKEEFAKFCIQIRGEKCRETGWYD